jgi:NADH-quinone oxidoreductase subunit G
MAKVTINGLEHQVPDGITIIQACEIADIEIPRFCYHERLAIAGNCRMCLVEVEGMPPKPVASCAMPVADGMKVHTNTPMVKKAREGVMEFLLANHPLDCPICDQAGECDLQDQAYQYGKGQSNYHEHKRAVKDKDLGPLVKTTMTRCIHCTRCVRFIEDVAGTVEMGAVGRGEKMEITTYLEKSIKSELSGNIIDLCPVGALTSKPYAFKGRSWELRKIDTIDVMDATCSNIRLDVRGLELMRILPRLNEEINEEWISDKTRFCYDGLRYQRLDKAYIKKNGKLKNVKFDEALDKVAQEIKASKPNEIGALTGQLSAFDDIFAFKKLLEKLGVKDFDCRLRAEKLDAFDKSSYNFNTTIAGIEEADACLLIGVNPRKDAPILNSRIRKRFLTKKLKIAAIGVDSDLTYDYQNLGNDVSLLKDILDGKNDFCKILENSQKPMLILGHDMVARKDGEEILNYAKKIAEKYNLIQDSWRGFNFLSKSVGLMNGLNSGFVSEAGIDKILEKKIIFLHGVDDDIDFEKLENSFVIYIGSHGDKGAHHADVILPAASYVEKEAIYINLEGRPQETTRVMFPLGEAREDWIIFSELAKKLDLDLEFENLAQLRNEMIAFDESLAQLNCIAKKSWKKSKDLNSKLDEGNLLEVTNFNFYLTNPIARASRILNKCEG